jgi:hypothetical protein
MPLFNLRCNEFYGYTLAAPDRLSDFERWDNTSDVTMQELIAGPTQSAKMAEANDFIAVTTAQVC